MNGDGKSIELKGLLWQEYTLPIKVLVKENTQLDFKFSYNGGSEESVDDIPYRLNMGPKAKINIKGIELNGYNISRNRDVKKDKKKEYDTLLGIGVVAIQNGKRVEKVYPIDKDAKGVHEIPIGKDFAKKNISKMIFYCNRGIAGFSSAKITSRRKNGKLLDPKNVIAKPMDAKLNVDGVEIIRDRNKGLNDIIKGVTIDLKMPSKSAIELNIEHDLEKSIDKIKKFIEAYNKYLEYHRELIKTAMSDKPGDFNKNLYKTGLFIGDSTIVRLESMLRRTVNNAYSSNAENPIRLLTQMGISTGAINADWENIKSGKLVLNEEKLMKAISENPEGVKMFFGSDNDGDNQPDSGMGYRLVYLLKPYVSSGKNIIASKIDLEDSSINSANERIKKHEEHLKKYEDKLRKKFSSMERAMAESKSQKSWMNQQFGNSDKEK